QNETPNNDTSNKESPKWTTGRHQNSNKMPNNDTKGKELPPMTKKEVPNKTPNDKGKSHRNRLHHDKSKRSDTGNENHQYER
ncbi:2082_t:CDS:1, partial [Gigaspora rosea]